jgi:CheY-like chemotaxis protein/HPt (histidine-containing phosphotransfer) domain-containing protein
VVLAQLEKLGYKADAVVNGAEAVEAVKRGGYDLVLMDCEMPVMDGHEATRRIRETLHSPIPIVALTADVMLSTQERCLSEGMNGYLAKPLELPRLAEMLARWIPAARPLDVAQTPPNAAEERTQIVFDEESLLRRLMDDRHLAGAVIEGFLKDVPAQLKNLYKLLLEGDAPGARLQAHTLKGAAATVGAESLRSVALAIEQAASAGQLNECNKILPQAEKELKRFENSVNQTGWVKIQNPLVVLRMSNDD